MGKANQLEFFCICFHTKVTIQRSSAFQQKYIYYIVKLFTHNRSDYAKLRCKIADPKIFKTVTEKHLRHIATSINLEAYQKPMVDCFSLDFEREFADPVGIYLFKVNKQKHHNIA